MAIDVAITFVGGVDDSDRESTSRLSVLFCYCHNHMLISVP